MRKIKFLPTVYITIALLASILVFSQIRNQHNLNARKGPQDAANIGARNKSLGESLSQHQVQIPCANLDPSICNDTPQIHDILLDPDGLVHVSDKIDTQWNNVWEDQRSRWLTGYTLARYLNAADTIQNNPTYTQMVTSMVLSYRNMNSTTYKRYEALSQLQDQMYGSFNHFSSIVRSSKLQQDDEVFFSQISQDVNFVRFMQDLSYIFDDANVITQTQYEELYFYLDDYPSTPNPLLSTQLHLFMNFFLYDPLDIPTTIRLKYKVLSYTKELADSQTYLSGCDFFSPLFNKIPLFMLWLKLDENPKRLPEYASAVQQLNLSCIQDMYGTWINYVNNAWGEYLSLIANNPDLFTNAPNREIILSHFNIQQSEVENHRIYGSQNIPLNNIDQFNAINALETHQLVGDYFFPPAKGYQIAKQNQTQSFLTNFDYTVYASSTTSPWIPNMTDYALEQPGRGTYIQYLLAHQHAMNELLYPGIYSLPVSKFNYNIFYVTTAEYLRERIQYLQQAGLLTGFFDYLIPDTSIQSSHAWKVQSIGPEIPGSAAKLSAEDVWRGSCGPDHQIYERYAYTHNNITYCLDRGGLHERGHVGSSMIDLYWSNSNEYFFNPISQERCELFASLRQKSNRFLANNILDSTLSISSDPKRFTIFDWEHVYKNSGPGQFINDSRNNNIFNYLTVRVNSNNSSNQIDRIELFTIQNDVLVQLPLSLTNDPVTSRINGFMIKTEDLFKYNDLFNHLVVYYTNGTTDSIVLPDYVIDNAYFQQQRLGNNIIDPSITITFLSTHGYPPTVEALCDTPAQRTATAEYYFNNVYAIYSGITTRTAEIEQDNQNYARIALPLDVSYVYRFKNPASEPYEFPETWQGPMPTTFPTISPTPPIITATPVITTTPTVSATPTPLAIILESFSASWLNIRQVKINWVTSFEINNTGFNIWRGTTPKEPTMKLNKTIIPSCSPGGTQGCSYSYTDTIPFALGSKTPPTYYYWIEDINMSGTVTRHGPAGTDGSGGP